jgi:ElaB/YqjD/DUF883 family membrane-anchored ribosome-binding protein
MTDGQNSGFGSPAIPTSSNDPGAAGQQMEFGAKTGEAVSKLAQAVQQAGSQAKETATALASEAGEKAKGLMHGQVEAGADFIGEIAQSVKVAADSLEHNSPQLASLVRGVAQQVQDFSETVRGQTMEEILETTSDFVRRNPALVFSAAAACGFMLFRVIRAGPSDGLQTVGQQGNFSPDGRVQQASSNFPGQSSSIQSPAGSYHGT